MTKAAAASRRPATYEDLLAVPDHLVAEIVAGELVVSPRPAGPHARSTSVVGMDVGGAYDRGFGGGPGGWWIVDEPELHLGPHVLVPDLAGWRRSRLPVYPATVGVEVAPDWVCEVLSDSTRRVDRVRKLPIYAEHGVGHAWLIDPLARTLEVFRLDGGRWSLVQTFAEEERAVAEPFDAITIELAALWDRGEETPEPA